MNGPTRVDPSSRKKFLSEAFLLINEVVASLHWLTFN